ncbi:unnamed protein product [Blumeria hordei]|uniref:Uncharacterized protein n=1 Tax=Blumeria hordei TaxID=2867405 RepID=A0A383UHN4_BLUHO|nr:unnamed protein product [Blumeria hordei]
MSDSETFIQLPLEMDADSKAVTMPEVYGTPSYTAELAALNDLHRQLLTLNAPIPPPPLPVNPKRSANVTKLRESGNTYFRQAKHADALRMYSLGLEMALKRPLWEPCAISREEVACLYANRAQVHMAMQNWPQGAIDAESSVEAKKAGNAKAWWRRGRCLSEMGRLDEAREWLIRGLEIEGDEADLLSLLKEITKTKKRNNNSV